MNASSGINPNKNIESNYDFDSVKRIPLYFGTKEKPLLAWLHITDSKQHSSTGVVICPPLAVEYMNSYRSLRYTADYFALAGIPTLRFDYHGTGDSSGIEEDENRLEEWLLSITLAMDKLKELTKCDKVGLFGFRMGATLAALVAEKTPIEFLISWAALNSGKKYIREINLIQMTGKVQTQDNSLLEAGGMGYWEQTVNDISRINLKNITPQAKRILIIPRDEQKNDAELYEAWKTKNLNIEQQYHIGSTLMLVDAHQTVVPHKTINSIVQWTLKAILSKKILNQSTIVTNNLSTTARITYANDILSNQIDETITVKESINYFGSNNNTFSIITESDKTKYSKLPTVIIVNSGANHRVGPSRLYVLLARKLSLMGFRCLRVDVTGIGDSIASGTEDENNEYIDSSNQVILEAIQSMDQNYTNKKYILMGLCSGAYFSFQAALKLQEINFKSCILINPLTFYWDDGSSEENSPIKEFRIWGWYKKAFTSKKSWKKLLKAEINFQKLGHAIINRLVTKFNFIKRILPNQKIDKHRDLLATDITRITNSNTDLQFILSRNDPGYDILSTNAGKTVRKLKRLKKIGIHFIENADHTFSRYTPRQDVIKVLIQYFSGIQK